MRVKKALFSMEFQAKDDRSDIIQVLIWPPIKDDENNSWFCNTLLDGIANEVQTKVVGEDPVQAILLAMKRIRIVIENTGKDYCYQGFEMREIFPLCTSNYSYGIEFQDEIEKMIRRRVHEEEHRLTEKFSKKYPDYKKPKN